MKAVQRLRRSLGESLRSLAARLDPPTQPYGEWDARQGCLVIKIPNGGTGMRLARIDLGDGYVANVKDER